VLALFVASLVSRLLFVGQHLSPSEVIGAIGALLSVLLLRRLDLQLWPSRAFAMAALAVFVAGIWPVTPVAAVTLAAPEPIWLPFAELAGLPADPGALPLLERLFLGIGLAWLAVHGGTRLLPPLPLVILIALTVEFLQQWIPGRVPDTTDVAALLIGAALASVAPRIDPRT
jgi:hypothetical protein